MSIKDCKVFLVHPKQRVQPGVAKYLRYSPLGIAILASILARSIDYFKREGESK